jgi:tetratricopeptide (TPR) repeat protein
VQSYSKYASALLDQKKYPDSIAYAGKTLDLDPNNLEAYYVRGIAETNTQNMTAAIADLQKARSIAAAAKSDDKTMGMIVFSLGVAQLGAGQFGEAATSAKDVLRFDPSRQAQLNKFAYATINNTAIELANGGKTADAVARLESAATAFPNFAGPFDAEAAMILATDKKPDWKKVAAEADKALALDPADGLGNYVRGVAAAQQNDAPTALTYLNKAKASSSYSTDANLAKRVDDALKALNPPAK